MSLNYETYLELKRLAGRIKEAPGEENDDMIIEFHSVTTLKATRDSVPYCSSGMNWALLQACIKRNPRAVLEEMIRRRFSPAVIMTAFRRAGFDFDDSELGSTPVHLVTNHLIRNAGEKYLPKTGRPIELPAFSAAAISWITYGHSVLGLKYELGDFMIFSRENGHHIACYEETKLFTYAVLGANQNDMVGVSDTYKKSRLLDVRRSSV